MALPGNFNTGHVRGAYVDLAGKPIVGSVIFTAKASRLVDPSEQLIILPVPLEVPLVNGALSKDLPATDDPDIIPTGFTYQVTEKFVGGLTYSIELPAGASVDLSSVVKVSPSGGVIVLPTIGHTVGLR